MTEQRFFKGLSANCVLGSIAVPALVFLRRLLGRLLQSGDEAHPFVHLPQFLGPMLWVNAKSFNWRPVARVLIMATIYLLWILVYYYAFCDELLVGTFLSHVETCYDKENGIRGVVQFRGGWHDTAALVFVWACYVLPVLYAGVVFGLPALIGACTDRAAVTWGITDTTPKRSKILREYMETNYKDGPQQEVLQQGGMPALYASSTGKYAVTKRRVLKEANKGTGEWGGYPLLFVFAMSSMCVAAQREPPRSLMWSLAIITSMWSVLCYVHARGTQAAFAVLFIAVWVWPPFLFGMSPLKTVASVTVSGAKEDIKQVGFSGDPEKVITTGVIATHKVSPENLHSTSDHCRYLCFRTNECAAYATPEDPAPELLEPGKLSAGFCTLYSSADGVPNADNDATTVLYELPHVDVLEGKQRADEGNPEPEYGGGTERFLVKREMTAYINDGLVRAFIVRHGDGIETLNLNTDFSLPDDLQQFHCTAPAT